jgi:glutamate-1-semialdehyde 2,1-aminomutase
MQREVTANSFSRSQHVIKKNTGQQLYVAAKTRIPGGTQLLSKRPEMFLPEQWPSYYSRAQGAFVWDLDGQRYTDMSISGIGACPLGFADPDVNNAVKAAIDAGSMATFNCPEEVQLAELLCELHPWAEMVRYARAGGEAMAIAVRIARAKTGRSKIAFSGYHGWADWYLAANLTEKDVLGRKGLLLTGLEPAGVPRELKETAYGFRFNKIGELKKIVARCKDDLAAIVCEPQRHEKPAPDFLPALREVANEVGAVLIFDEITSAMRLNTGGVHLLYGVSPDLAVFAKGIGNGFPIAAVIGIASVMEAAQSSFISSTCWTERVGPTAAIATIQKHRRINAAERMVAAGRRVQTLWRETAQDAGLDVTIDHPDMPPLSSLRFNYSNARAMQTLHCQMMLDRGFLDNCGFYATCAHTDDIIDSYANAIRDAFPALGDAQRQNRVEKLLRGPVGHSGFARLT